MMCLPAILVSAPDSVAASKIISMLIGDSEQEEDVDVEEGGGGGGGGVGGGEGARVWRLRNKYYEARVQLVAALDGTAPPHDALARVHAHLVYLTRDECRCAGDAARRLAERAGAARGAGEVRLALADTAAEPGALLAAAARLRYELVPLRETGPPPPHPADPFPELYGVERARAALHAHTWPGLRRRDVTPGGGGGARDEEAGAVERAELFADALQALGAARELPAARRRDHAEELVGAFCRALGLDPLDL